MAQSIHSCSSTSIDIEFWLFAASTESPLIVWFPGAGGISMVTRNSSVDRHTNSSSSASVHSITVEPCSHTPLTTRLVSSVLVRLVTS